MGRHYIQGIPQDGAPSQAPAQQVVMDESRLIDLPLAEQKRRGNELLSLLSDPWRHCGLAGQGAQLGPQVERLRWKFQCSWGASKALRVNDVKRADGFLKGGQF